MVLQLATSQTSLFDSMSDGIYILDTQRRITYWSKGAERLSGFSAQEVAGHCCADNILMHVDRQGNNLCQSACPVAQTLLDGKPRQAEVFLHHKEGHRVPVWVRVNPIVDGQGKVSGAVEVFNDNSKMLEARQRILELERMSMLDTLTRLPNRRYIQEQIISRLEEYRRLRWPFGVLFMDLDQLKHINDTHGRQMGDELLKMVGRTFEHNSRPYDVVGRWSGEEFVGVLSNVSPQNLGVVAERYRALIKESVLYKGDLEIRATISIGGTMAQAGDDLDSVLARADRLLYESRRAGGNQVILDTADSPES